MSLLWWLIVVSALLLFFFKYTSLAVLWNMATVNMEVLPYSDIYACQMHKKERSFKTHLNTFFFAPKLKLGIQKSMRLERDFSCI